MKTLLAILLLSTYSSVAQTILTQFDGDIGTGGSATSKPTYRDHPDATAAANGSQVVEVTGQNVNVYSYDGKLLKSTHERFDQRHWPEGRKGCRSQSDF